MNIQVSSYSKRFWRAPPPPIGLRDAWLAIFLLLESVKTNKICGNAWNDLLLCAFVWNPYFPLSAWKYENEKNLRGCVIGYTPNGGLFEEKTFPRTKKCRTFWGIDPFISVQTTKVTSTIGGSFVISSYTYPLIMTWKRKKVIMNSRKANTHFFIGKLIFHVSLELLTKFWKTSLRVAYQLLSFIVYFTRFSENQFLLEKKPHIWWLDNLRENLYE